MNNDEADIGMLQRSQMVKLNIHTLTCGWQLLELTIATKFTITIVIDSQKYYHDRLSIVDFTIAILFSIS